MPRRSALRAASSSGSASPGRWRSSRTDPGRRAGRQPRPEDVAHRAHLPQDDLQGSRASRCSATCTRSTTRWSSASASSACRPARSSSTAHPPASDGDVDPPDLSRPRRSQRARCRATPDRAPPRHRRGGHRRRCRREGLTMSLQLALVIRPRRPASAGGASAPILGVAVGVPVVGGASARSSTRPNCRTACPGSRTSSAACCRRTSDFMDKLVKPAHREVQIALWGTLLGVVLALPICFFAARNLSPDARRLPRHCARC